MIIEIIDKIIAQASQEAWVIKYIALSPQYMEALVDETLSTTGRTDVIFDSIAFFKDVPLKTKDIVGFQVVYELF
jgi:hypothetical protein